MAWLATKEVAELLGYSERAIRDKAKNGEYAYRYIPSSTGRGGRKIEISMESLPEQAQKAYHNQVNGDSQFVINTDYTSTKAQKEKGELKRLAVAEWKKFTKKMKKEGMLKGKSTDLFVTNWNSEHDDLHISAKLLYDWMDKLKKGESLIDKRGGYNRGQSSIPKYYQEFFLSLYLQQSKPPFDACLRRTQNEANKNGDVIQGTKAFKNLLKNMDASIIARAREGQKYFEDNFMPTMQRDYSSILPNDIWVSDHHLWDVFVRIPDGKGGWKPVRPWGSYWMDMRTRKVLFGFIREESPNSDIVLLSFGMAVEKYGIPKKVYLDNGKDYKARDLFYPEGHLSKQDKQNKEIVQQGISKEELKKSYSSLAGNLQMEVTYAIPYNARAKPIERLFNTLENDFGKFYPSYAGSNAKKRPEDLKDLDIMEMVTMEEFIEQHKKFIEDIYNNSPHSGNSMDNKSPNYWYATLEFSKRTMASEALYFTLMRSSRPRKIQKEGINFNKELYLNAEFQNHVGAEIFVRYNPVKPEIIYVFDINENFLFIAERREKYGFELTDEDYEKANKEKKIARNATLNGYKHNNSVRSTETISQCLSDYADSLEQIDTSDTSKVVEPVRNEKMEEAVRRIHASVLDKNYEDVLRANEKIKKQTNDKQKELVNRFKKNMLDRANATAKQA